MSAGTTASTAIENLPPPSGPIRGEISCEILVFCSRESASAFVADSDCTTALESASSKIVITARIFRIGGSRVGNEYLVAGIEPEQLRIRSVPRRRARQRTPDAH